jgi:hypothetical protein
MKWILLKALFLVFLFLNSVSNISAATERVPQQAKTYGYTLNTFNSDFQANNVDLEDTRRAGFAWYVGKFFGWRSTPLYNFEFMKGHSIRVKTGKNYSLATATRVKGEKRWVGQAFGGGGYFEAEIRFNPSIVIAQNEKKSWPCFWAMAIEHMANLPEEQWPGQKKGYVHFIEVDIMEYLIKSPRNKNIYVAGMHDWFGVWKETCTTKQFCNHRTPYKEVLKTAPSNTDYSKFHKYGFLWIPATNTTNGWGQFYFDDKPIGAKITWSKFDGQKPSLKKEKWTFGILDEQHLVLILGAGENQPMEIRTVRVWQNSKDKNWIQ